MYVLCVGMYRACSTWQYEVAAHLIERHRGGVRLGYLTGEEFAEYDDAEGRPTDVWRVLKSHEEHPRFRSALAEGRAVAIYAHRDLRDVAYSLMHKRRLSFDALIVQGMVHQVLANDRFWTTRPGVLIQQYEELIAAPEAGIEQIARFLGIAPAPGEVAQVATEYSLQANRRRAAELGQRLRELGVDLEDPSNAQTADRDTLLHWNHLREGRAGGWRDQATPRERVILAALGNRWLRERGYEPDDPPRVASGPGALRALARDGWLVGRGWLTCQLRCAALRHPTASRWLKTLLGIAPPPRPHAATVSAARAGHPSGNSVAPDTQEATAARRPEAA